MKYAILFERPARKAFLGFDAALQARLIGPIEALADNPRPVGVKKLKGRRDYWRIRVGDYRIVYNIQDNRLLIVVIRIGHRSQVYND